VDDARWHALERLSNDSIVGVRIGVARLAGSILGMLLTLHLAPHCSL
jgi:serine/threonine-protein phosphatase 4 regulatory subunit 1